MTVQTTDALDLAALSPWAPELAHSFVTLASDIALVLDEDGVIQHVAPGGCASLSLQSQRWVGQTLSQVVTVETKSKIALLLKEVLSSGVARRREVNHTLDNGANMAMAYTAIRLGKSGALLAVGRDLSAISAIQQRFLHSQQEMERGYWRAREAEGRYRLLFQVATDAVLVVDASTLEIVEANQAASQLFDLTVEQLVGRDAMLGFERHSRNAIVELLNKAKSSGQPIEIRARLLGKVLATSVVATTFRVDDTMRLLMRVRTMDMPGIASDLNATLARLVDSTSDGVVVTDSIGRILIANPAFLKLVQMNTEASVKGRPLMDWVSLSDEQFAALLAQVRRRGITRRIASQLMASDAAVSNIQVSAALLSEYDQECIGFTIHFVTHAKIDPTDPTGELREAIALLANRVGKDPMPDLIQAAAELLERHFLQVAAERSESDPAAGAGAA